METISFKNIFAVFMRNFLIYSKNWKLSLAPRFFEPVFYLLGLGLGVGFYVQEMGNVSYVTFIAPGLVAMAAMNGMKTPCQRRK